MKKILLSLMIVCSGLSALSQINGARFGVKAGVNLPGISYSDGSETQRTSSFYLGGVADIRIGELFSIQPGLIYTGKGSELNSTTVTMSFVGIESDFQVNLNTRTTSINYIEIPVNAILNFPLGSGKVFVGAGPYYAVGLSGKIRDEYLSSNPAITGSNDRNLQFGRDGDLRRSDFGLNFLAGYEFGGGFAIQAGYGLGLYNHKLGDNLVDRSGNTGDISKRNNVLSVGAGFFF